MRLCPNKSSGTSSISLHCSWLSIHQWAGVVLEPLHITTVWSVLCADMQLPQTNICDCLTNNENSLFHHSQMCQVAIRKQDCTNGFSKCSPIRNIFITLGPCLNSKTEKSRIWDVSLKKKLNNKAAEERYFEVCSRTFPFDAFPHV